VFISLKKPDVAPGDATDTQMELIADLADRYSFGEVRVTHTQNLVLGDVEQDKTLELWRILAEAGLATPNIGTLTDMICCPGLDFCSLANAGSIEVAKHINERFEDYDYLYDLGEIDLKMSGCMNACGHHHVGAIGILGVDKGGEEWYQITIGGAAGSDASLGSVIGPLMLGLSEFRAERERWLARAGRLGVILVPADDEQELVPDLARLALVAAEFTTVSEGRGYTQGRLLRERWGFAGELRARGAVRRDLVFLLARCGFNSFELPESEFEGAVAALRTFSAAYQSSNDRGLGAALRHR